MSKERRWVDVAGGSKENQVPVKKAEPPKVAGTVGTIKVSYSVNGFWADKIIVAGKEYDTLKVPNAGHVMIEGSPMVPQAGLYVAIPENAEVKDVKVLKKKETELPGKYYLLPSPKPTIEDEEDIYAPDAKVYGSDMAFPGKDFELQKTDFVEDMKVAHIVLFLGSYKPKSQKMSMLKSIDLEISYKISAKKAVRKAAPRDELKDMILNWDSVAATKEKGGE